MGDIALGVEHSLDISKFLSCKPHPFLMINVTTVVHTWLIMALVAFLVLVVRFLALRYTLVYYGMVKSCKILHQMIVQSLGFFSFNHFCFISSIFIFILMCNIAPVIPWLEEPTQDLNTTLALGICSFLYIQGAAIAFTGFSNYIYFEFLSPLWLLPLHLVGKVASILSISLRLFGNIFGGAIISKIYTAGALKYATMLYITHYFAINVLFTLLITLVTVLLSTVITVFFTVLEGFLQAFVFTILSLTYLSIAVRHES
ncbi:MAG TPA: F0F1 ATP synthase subunit A [Patescibacteria group bacterium]|jgi:F-type H+-transporting ATPase subunit a|nr:F0F1 ATP synthase subunit A [Patescibacteria group bacterium]